jgi:hypothetical protein
MQDSLQKKLYIILLKKIKTHLLWKFSTKQRLNADVDPAFSEQS